MTTCQMISVLHEVGYWLENNIVIQSTREKNAIDPTVISIKEIASEHR